MDGENILELEPDERAREASSWPSNTRAKFPASRSRTSSAPPCRPACRKAKNSRPPITTRRLYEKMDLLGMDRTFTSRSVNEGFSGGEKKRNEILQMAMLEPKYAMLDETDCGLDIDALKIVAHGRELPARAESRHSLDHALPAAVELHRARSCPRDGAGRIVRSGGKELALELEEKGYDWIARRRRARNWPLD